MFTIDTFLAALFKKTIPHEKPEIDPKNINQNDDKKGTIDGG